MESISAQYYDETKEDYNDYEDEQDDDYGSEDYNIDE